MSKELKKLENMATTKCITDHEQIDRIVSYLLSLPFSYFRKEEARYQFLRNDLSNGFGVDRNALDRMSFQDILVLIGYEPGNTYFDPPDKGKRGFSRKLNAAGSSYVLALIINNLSKTDIRLKEFTCIGLAAYIDYLKRKVAGECRNGLISIQAGSTIVHTVDWFDRRAGSYLSKYMDGRSSDRVTIGDLISEVVKVCGRSWICTVEPLEKYVDEIIDHYDLINRLFMDAVRIPLVCSDRERFREIITKYSNESQEGPIHIDYGPCYEHGIIHKFNY